MKDNLLTRDKMTVPKCPLFGDSTVYICCVYTYIYVQELLAGTHKEELHSVSIAQKTLGMLTQVWRRASSAVALGNLRGSPVVSFMYCCW